ncbi:MAG TPA: amidohydrolase family protein [Nitrolancea sp.]|nr:amidohydrolase family protein [Nitrolancea sp.]
MIIDMHSHYFPLDALRNQRTISLSFADEDDGSHTVSILQHRLNLDYDLVDLDRQRAALHRQKIDRRTLMPPPFTILYELHADDGLAWSRLLNDGTSAAARSDPGSFVGFATVPLQNPTMAVAELQRAVNELGLEGVEILSNIDGDGLDNPALEPFWAAVEALRIPILIHPNNVLGVDRLGPYYLRNLLGNPTETAQAGARLLFSGVLERYPELKIILSHGGGTLPHLIGRLQHGFEVRPECHQFSDDPIARMNRFYYDTVVFNPMILRHVIDIVGIEQVVLGTDFPFDMGETDPVDFVSTAGLSTEARDLILNAGERLIGQG